MSTFFDNLTLGWAGTKDLVTHALGGESHYAADVYGAQTAHEQAIAQQLAPDDAAALEATITTNAEAADAGSAIVVGAAKKTVNDIAEKVKAAIDYTPLLVAGAAGVVVLVAGAVVVSRLPRGSKS